MEREVGSQSALEPSCPNGTHRSYRCSPVKQLRTTPPGEPRPGLPPVSPLRATPATGGSQPQQVRLVIETRHRNSYLLEGPLCQQPAAVEVDDRVCAPDRSQPVCDGDRGHF